jgi:hypothetical protein
MTLLFLILVGLHCRYMQLLSKYQPEQPNITPLSSTFALLCSKNAAADSVVALIMDIVDSLLSSEDMQMPSDTAPIVVDFVANEANDKSMIFELLVFHSCRFVLCAAMYHCNTRHYGLVTSCLPYYVTCHCIVSVCSLELVELLKLNFGID